MDKDHWFILNKVSGPRLWMPPVEADQGPENVLPQPRLHRDVKCLIELTALVDPPSPPAPLLSGGARGSMLRAWRCHPIRIRFGSDWQSRDRVPVWDLVR